MFRTVAVMIVLLSASHLCTAAPIKLVCITTYTNGGTDERVFTFDAADKTVNGYTDGQTGGSNRYFVSDDEFGYVDAEYGGRAFRVTVSRLTARITFTGGNGVNGSGTCTPAKQQF